MEFKKVIKTIRLEEAVEAANTGADAIRRAPIVEYKTDYKCLRIGDVSNNRPFFEWGFTNASEEIIERFILKEGDIIIARTGSTIGSVRYIHDDLDSVYNNGLIRIKINDKFNPKFIYYCLLTREFEGFINGISGGTSTQPNMKIKDFLQFLIPYFNLNVQRKIVKILSSLDQKIELNNRIIANLEEQAQAIFKNWFIDFEPFKDGEFVESELGRIPKGWEVSELLELADFVGGSQPPKSEHIYDYQEGYVRFIQNRDYSVGDSHLTYIKESKRNRLADEKDILMDKYGEAGKVRYGIAGAYNVALAKIEPLKDEYREYIRRFLEQENVQRYIYNSSIASTRPSVSRKTLTNLKMLLPDRDTIKEFSSFSNLIIDLVLELKKENETLAQTRDTLLPKLMSGEIDVTNINIEDEIYG